MGDFELERDDDADHTFRSGHVENIFVWQKMSTAGSEFSPKCREGHTSVIYNHKLYVFGGIEDGLRQNNVVCCDLKSKCWREIRCEGDIPIARSYHVSCLADRFMIIHGGEAMIHNKLTSLDDLYALDLEDNYWVKLPQRLAPLACSGHTMNLVKFTVHETIVEGLAVFGGYCSHLNACCNVVYLCEVDDILRAAKTALAAQEEAPHHGLSLHAVRWRTLKCFGKFPSPRCRHSACTIPMSQNRCQLIIFGGMTKNSASTSTTTTTATAAGCKVMHDLYILDLNRFTWIVPNAGSDALADGIHAVGPAPIFGHVALAVKNMVTPHEVATRTLDSNCGRYDMLIYGGSTNPVKPSAGCQFGLFQFNTEAHTWRKANTGFLFPPERCGHSLSVCVGWSPIYNYPSQTISVTNAVRSEERAISLSQSQGLVSSTKDIQAKASSEDGLRCCAVIFSGLSNLERASEVWCLDMTPGRSAGINQFDYSVANLVDVSHTNTQLTNQAIITLGNSTSKRGLLKRGGEKSLSPAKSPGHGGSSIRAVTASRIDLENFNIAGPPPALRVAANPPIPVHSSESPKNSGRMSSSSHGGHNNTGVLTGLQALQQGLGSQIARTNHWVRSSRQQLASSGSLALIPEAAEGGEEGSPSSHHQQYAPSSSNNISFTTTNNVRESRTVSNDYDDIDGSENENDIELLRTASNLSAMTFDSVRVVSDHGEELDFLSSSSPSQSPIPESLGIAATMKSVNRNTGFQTLQQTPSNNNAASTNSINHHNNNDTNMRKSALNNYKLLRQQSLGFRSQAKKTQKVIETEELAASFLKCRIQRAMADKNTENERCQATALNARCDQLSQEAEDLEKVLEGLRSDGAMEGKALSAALDASQESIRLLGVVNLEAVRLARLFTSS